MAEPYEYKNPLEFLENRLAEDKARGLFEWGNLEIIAPSVEMIGMVPDGEQIMRHLESAIRTAYKSEDKIGPDSHLKILKHILSLKHESTLEHMSLSFRVITSRGVSHELVRHRIASYTQESTRYVNYGKKAPKIIMPWHLLFRSDEDKRFWYFGQLRSIESYNEALERGWKPQDARGLLTNDLKTEVVTTMNLRSLRNFGTLRTPGSAHPDMQVPARQFLRLLYNTVPVLFQDIQDKIDAAAWI
jgi:thymidylate synthase (FAD)